MAINPKMILKNKQSRKIIFTLFKRMPSEVVLHYCNTYLSGVVVKCPSSCPTLEHFNFANIVLSIGTPDRGYHD